MCEVLIVRTHSHIFRISIHNLRTFAAVTPETGHNIFVLNHTHCT